MNQFAINTAKIRAQYETQKKNELFNSQFFLSLKQQDSIKTEMLINKLQKYNSNDIKDFLFYILNCKSCQLYPGHK
jgi:hypothetical protein